MSEDKTPNMIFYPVPYKLVRMRRAVIVAILAAVAGFCGGFFLHMPGDTASRVSHCTAPYGAGGQEITVHPDGGFNYGTTGWPSQVRVCTVTGWEKQ